jgi:hypothetical protein
MFLSLQGIRDKKTSLPSGRPAIFFCYKQNATNLPSGMFLVALCMCTYRHKTSAKINRECVLSKFNDIFLKKPRYFIPKHANNIIEA